MILLKRTSFLLLVNFLARFLCNLLSPVGPDDYSFVFQIKNANLSVKFLVFFYVTGLSTNIPLQETIDIARNLILIQNPNLNITKKNFLFLLHPRLIFFLTVNFIIKLMEQPQVLPWFLSLLIFQ